MLVYHNYQNKNELRLDQHFDARKLEKLLKNSHKN